MPLPFPVPPLEAVLSRRREEALAAFTAVGWRPYATPIGLDAARRRLLNIDLTEPDVAFQAGAAVAAVAHVEADRAGRVTHLEITAAEPVDALAIAAALIPGAEEPRVSGGPGAREWIWGPESGSAIEVAGEPVRLWVCAEQAYGDRLWAVATLVRRAG